MQYLINDIYPCLQGEGVLTGVPMVLVRLHGCPVGCAFCDTKETWIVDPEKETSLKLAIGTNENYFKANASDICAYILQNHRHYQWVLITGGEPANQELGPIVKQLHALGFKVAIETSGTALGHVAAGFDWVCVSPKINNPAKLEVLPGAIAVADEIKHVVGKQSDITDLDFLLAASQLKPGVQICLQPVSMSERATQLCIKMVQQRGWRLSIQTHKLLAQR